MKNHRFYIFVIIYLLNNITSPLIAQIVEQLETQEEELAILGFSPVILPKDALDVGITNSLSSFWLLTQQFNPATSAFEDVDRSRYSRLDHITKISYGFSAKQRWDLGAEFRYALVYAGKDADSNPFHLFNPPANTFHQRGLTAAGIRLRYAPLKKYSGLTLTGSVLFPTGKDPMKRRNLAFDRTEMGVAATLIDRFNEKVSYYLLGDWRIRFSNVENPQTVHLPTLAAYLIFDLYDQRLYLFPGLATSYSFNQKLDKLNNQLYGSLGLQYQSLSGFNVFINTQTPFIFDSGNPLRTWERKSYLGWTLGLRLRLG